MALTRKGRAVCLATAAILAAPATLLAVTVLRGATNACYSDNPNVARLIGKLPVMGSSLEYDAHVKAFIPGFRLSCAQEAGLVDYINGSDEAAVTSMFALSVQWAMLGMDRPMSNAEWTDLESRNNANRQMGQFPAAIEPLAVIYNLDDPSCSVETLKLSSNTLALIYSGLITSWNHAAIVNDNPGLKNCTLRIQVAHDVGPPSLVFKDYLSKRNADWNTYKQPQFINVWPPSAPVSCVARGGHAMALCVGSTPGAIGFAEYRLVQGGGIPIAQVDNPAHQFSAPSYDGCTTAVGADPSPRNIAVDWSSASYTDSASGYPICALYFADVRLDMCYAGGLSSADLGVTQDYLAAIYTDVAQASLPHSGYASLPQALRTTGQNGISQLSCT